MKNERRCWGLKFYNVEGGREPPAERSSLVPLLEFACKWGRGWRTAVAGHEPRLFWEIRSAQREAVDLERTSSAPRSFTHSQSKSKPLPPPPPPSKNITQIPFQFDYSPLPRNRHKLNNMKLPSSKYESVKRRYVKKVYEM